MWNVMDQRFKNKKCNLVVKESNVKYGVNVFLAVSLMLILR